MNGLIYAARNKITGKQYVGQTVQGFEKRKAQHISDALAEKDKSHFHNSIRTYGEEAFEWAIIVEGIENQRSLNELEMYWIKELNTFNTGYNLTTGGEGYTVTEEARKKRSKAQKGKHHTEETRKKISKSQKGEKNSNWGKHFTEEARKKISEAQKDKWKDEEYRKKMSEARKGLFIGEKHPQARAVYQLDKITKEIIIEFPYIREAERKTGVANSSISKCCTGKRKSAGGFCWCYVEDYEKLYGKDKSQTIS